MNSGEDFAKEDCCCGEQVESEESTPRAGRARAPAGPLCEEGASPASLNLDQATHVLTATLLVTFKLPLQDRGGKVRMGSTQRRRSRPTPPPCYLTDLIIQQASLQVAPSLPKPHSTASLAKLSVPLLILRHEMLGIRSNTTLLSVPEGALLTTMEQVRFLLSDVLRIGLHLVSNVDGRIFKILLAIDGGLCLGIHLAFWIGAVLRRSLVGGRQTLSIRADRVRGWLGLPEGSGFAGLQVGRVLSCISEAVN